MKESLPPHVLKEKLPRFLQKCAQNFESDRKYRNDSRYLRVWIELVMEHQAYDYYRAAKKKKQNLIIWSSFLCAFQDLT